MVSSREPIIKEFLITKTSSINGLNIILTSSFLLQWQRSVQFYCMINKYCGSSVVMNVWWPLSLILRIDMGLMLTDPSLRKKYLDGSVSNPIQNATSPFSTHRTWQPAAGELPKKFLDKKFARDDKIQNKLRQMLSLKQPQRSLIKPHMASFLAPMWLDRVFDASIAAEPTLLEEGCFG